MTINEFLKSIQKVFGHVEYKATSINGQVFKSKGWRDDKIQSNKIQPTEFNRKN